MFINREEELKFLQEKWRDKNSQLIVLYGKRRVGKTELIKQFLKKHKGVYFLADKRTHKEQLLELGRVVGTFFKDIILERRGFDNWLEAFEYLSDKSKRNRFTVAIDEYPYLVETQKAATSLFQKGWDQYLKKSNIFLILCGSSISMMESETMDYKAPLYGRRTGQLLLKGMNIVESQKFFPRRSFLNFMHFYAITGGMPAYLQAFSKFRTIENAVEDLCFNKNGLFHNEINFMLKQELREPKNYFAILKAISWGKTKVSEIASNAGLEIGLVNKYLKTLGKLHLVSREVPVTETKPEKSKKGIYILSENFVRFWFQYVYAYQSDLEIGNYNQVTKRFKKYSNVLEAIAYEDTTRRQLYRMQTSLFPMDKVGRYWDGSIEIDGVGFNLEQRKIVFSEAKWSERLITLKVLNKLMAKAEQLLWFNNKREEYYVLFAKSGFDKSLIEEARKNQKIKLISQLGKNVAKG